uniref:Uncharacterized protein n=1 Tax=Nelumbo nucifera TaxID=4432 RepID=A0A822YL51_NELNU|nr:TPA_asm: hypothetical protein HUJ06_011162 [Nelumbo nucifera]
MPETVNGIKLLHYLLSHEKTPREVYSGDNYPFQAIADPFGLYRELRIINSSPYMAYLQLRGCILVVSSPEVFTCVKYGSRIASIGMEENLGRQMLPLMSLENRDKGSAFMVTVNAHSVEITRVSGTEGTKIIATFSSPNSNPEDFKKLGHMLHLKYRNGFLRRGGYTEASVYLVTFIGLWSVLVISSAIIDVDDDSLASMIKGCKDMDQNTALHPSRKMYHGEAAMKVNNNKLVFYAKQAKWMTCGENPKPPVLSVDGLDMLPPHGITIRTHTAALVDASWAILRCLKAPTKNLTLVKYIFWEFATSNSCDCSMDQRVLICHLLSEIEGLHLRNK